MVLLSKLSACGYIVQTECMCLCCLNCVNVIILSKLSEHGYIEETECMWFYCLN